MNVAFLYEFMMYNYFMYYFLKIMSITVEDSVDVLSFGDDIR
jgi:hypothetical protein